MLDFDQGPWGHTPFKGGEGGPQHSATIRELQPIQVHHLQWHLLRAQDGRCRTPIAKAARAASPRPAAPRIDGVNVTVIGCFVDGHLRGAIEIRRLRAAACKAQIVLSVEQAWQGHGIGTALVAEAIHAARQRGIEHLYFSCHALNFRMQRIADRFAAKIGFEDCACFADIAVTSQAEQTSGKAQ